MGEGGCICDMDFIDVWIWPLMWAAMGIRVMSEMILEPVRRLDDRNH